jgi:hypothetical protein
MELKQCEEKLLAKKCDCGCGFTDFYNKHLMCNLADYESLQLALYLFGWEDRSPVEFLANHTIKDVLEVKGFTLERYIKTYEIFHDFERDWPDLENYPLANWVKHFLLQQQFTWMDCIKYIFEKNKEFYNIEKIESDPELKESVVMVMSAHGIKKPTSEDIKEFVSTHSLEDILNLPDLYYDTSEIVCTDYLLKYPERSYKIGPNYIYYFGDSLDIILIKHLFTHLSNIYNKRKKDLEVQRLKDNRKRDKDIKRYTRYFSYGFWVAVIAYSVNLFM